VGIDWQDLKLALRGKIDRVCVKDNDHIVIDYKKKTTPGKQDIFTVRHEPTSYQMPFYYFLLTELGFYIVSASYYSFENCSFAHVFNPHDPHAFGGTEELESAVEKLKQNIVTMAERINSGEFSIRMHNNNTNCSYCDFRSVCRMKFVLT
jgi:ATP-dependent helicase/DNAse subunit B